MPLTLKQIRYFIAAADFGQISLAAKQFNISQSTVTASIHQLEEDVGVPLFERLPSGVSLTNEGARFLQHAHNIMAAVTEAVQTPLSTETNLSGNIRVGVTNTVAGYFMTKLYVRFTRSYPNLKLEMFELPRPKIETGLLKGGLDIAVILVSNLKDKQHLEYETLLRSKRRLWLPSNHPLCEASTITFNDVSQEPYIMLTIDEADQTADKYWIPSGLRPKTIFTTSAAESVRSMVAAGMGVTILSDMVYRPWSLDGQRIETVNLSEDIPTMDVGLAWNPENTMTPMTKAFMDFMSLSFSGVSSD
ncbi:MAG: LysR family transcriptional regulator [Sneathiella sp.]|uniref:LysR family transcriptional regulator n=1 Tax=Sneathiella sp. TaxID=1964365 RepID=UPI0030015844